MCDVRKSIRILFGCFSFDELVLQCFLEHGKRREKAVKDIKKDIKKQTARAF